MTTTVTLKSPEPYTNFWAGAQNISSDGSGLIRNVDLHSQVCRDLLSAGCSVVTDPAPAADGDLPEPEA
jgi:hypothetical protein